MRHIFARVRSEFSRIGPVMAWTLVAAAGNFLAGILIARTLGPEGRGLVSIVVSVSGLASVAGALGTNVSFRTLWPKGLVNIKGYASLSFFLAVVSAPLFVGTAVAVGYWIDRDVLTTYSLFSFVAFGMTNLVWLQFKEALNGVGEISFSAAIGAIGSGVFLCLIVLATAGEVANHNTVLWSYCLMNVFQSILCWVRMRRFGDGDRARGAHRLLRSGPPYLGYFFGQELALRLNRPLIGAFSDSAQVGFYSVGAGLAEILRLPVLAVSQYVLLDSASGRIGPKAIAKRAFLWSALMGSAVCVMWPFAPWIISFLYGAAYLPGATAFRILLLAQFLLVPFLIFSRGLVGMGGRWVSSIPGIAGLVVLLGASPALVSKWGATGGAFSAGFAYLAMSVAAVSLSFWLSRKLNSGE